MRTSRIKPLGLPFCQMLVHLGEFQGSGQLCMDRIVKLYGAMMQAQVRTRLQTRTERATCAQYGAYMTSLCTAP